MAKIFIIDDDMAISNMICDNLKIRGHEAYRIESAKTAFENIDKIVSGDLIIIDIIMPSTDGKTQPANHTAGIDVYLEIRKRNKIIPIIIYSLIQDNSIIEPLKDDSQTFTISKWEGLSLKELVQKIYDRLGITYETEDLQSFIVHGHSDAIKLELKNYLQNILKLPEPIILHEKPNSGRTIIDKFEKYAQQSSIVFVILTPDDVSGDTLKDNDAKYRARQNVIFELGYFFGTLGRETGRVILLYVPPIELPSDISGVVYIDISSGILAAGEKIRLEVENVRKQG